LDVDCILCGTQFEAHDGPCPQCGWNADALSSAKSLRAGELVRGKYEISSCLGVGRLGTAFLVADTEAGADAVLKLVHPGLIGNEEIGRRFLVAMRALKHIDHPCMVRVLDANCEADKYFVVSELLDGVSLRDLMDKRRSQGKGFSIREILPILTQIASFFAESGFAEHGALSPENIWIKPDGLKLLDVGWARSLPIAAVGHRLTAKSRVRGYVAPELLRGKSISARSDIYSLGVLIGEMFTQMTFDGRPETFALADPDLPADVDAVLRRALLVDPAGRYASVSDLVDAVRAVDAPGFRAAPPPENPPPERMGRTSAAPRPPARPSTPPPRPRRAIEFGIDVPQSESTVQVSMEDVIRAHFGGEPTSRDIAKPPERKIPWARIAPIKDRDPDHTPIPGHVALITPKRPVRRDSLPPQPARVSPPSMEARADALAGHDEDEDTSVKRSPTGGRPQDRSRREVTQEIDLDALTAAAEPQGTHEGTQEIDLAMIEGQITQNAVDAATKLEAQAEAGVRSSTEELIRRAERLDGVDPRLVRAAHTLEAEKRGGRSAKAAEVLKQRTEHLDGIDPRLLRAAARLEEAKINEVPEPAKPEDGGDAGEAGDDWRERLSQTDEDSVISFLASPVVEPTEEVRGFPLTQHRRQQNRPPTKPPAPASPPVAPPPRGRNRRREPPLARALYDESGETDDQSQPTMLVHPANMPRTAQRAAIDRRLLYLELALPVAAGLLFAGMLILLAVAATMR
jgi:serine/threonine protein kinase